MENNHAVETDVSAASSALEDLRTTFRKHLYLPDTTSVDFTAAVVIANRLPSDPVWGLIVGPPGSGKTEAVESTGDLPEIRPLSMLTRNTLLSAKERKGEPASLLHRMDNAGQSLLALKDFTTILSMHTEERAQILGALREVYDGKLYRETGMGTELRWEGRLGFLAGVTPVIDLHQGAIAILGERFLYLRLPDQSEKVVTAALDEDHETTMRAALRVAMRDFVESVPIKDVPLTDDARERLKILARRTAWLRTSVARDSYGKRDILIRPSRETPTRIAKQLRQLWRAATLMGHEDPFAFVDRIAKDSTSPADRIAAVDFVAEGGRESSTAIRKHLRLPYSSGRRVLEDLESLGIFEIVEEGGEGKPNIYSIAPGEAAELFGNPSQEAATRERAEKKERVAASRDGFESTQNGNHPNPGGFASIVADGQS